MTPSISPPVYPAEARLGPVATVDLAKVRGNYAILTRVSGQALCSAIVKGDGYGLGMLAVAEAAWQAGARLFFVARFDDGVALRAAFPGARIAVLDGLGTRRPGAFAKERLIPVLSTITDCRSWVTLPTPAPYMLHVDTAMNRLGLKPHELAGAVSILRDSKSPIAAYLTHLASADDSDIDLCRLQVARFEAALQGLPPAPRSIANSSGLFLDRAWQADITRPGKSLYGINPAQAGKPNPVDQVLSVHAPILQLGEIAAGDSVGYSATYRARQARRIATLGIGYANGYLRALSNKGMVAFAGMRAAVIGRVSMDLVTVDVTDLPHAALGPAVAEILGPTIGLTELATLAGTNEYELQIALGRGCRRIYINAMTDGM
jgi:alanine racemase